MPEDRDREEMQQLLAYANFSKVAEAVGVKRAAVSQWARGKHVTPARLEQVRELLGTTKESRPSDVERRLEGIESLLDVIARATPGIDVKRVAEIRRERDALLRSQSRDGERQSGDQRPPGTPAGTGL